MLFVMERGEPVNDDVLSIELFVHESKGAGT
jgi:hypothetical protein